jgi:hypothetical protein
MPVKAKYIKDLPLKVVLDGSESLLVQDLNGTQQVPLGTIVDEIKQNSQEKIREIESELAQTNAQLSDIKPKINGAYFIPEYRMTFYKQIASDDLVMKNDVPVEQQGLAYVGGNRFVTTFCCLNKPLQTAPTEVAEVDLTDKYNPVVIRKQQFYGLGKANSCCYSEGKIYIAVSGWYNEMGSSVKTNEIAVIDYNTFELLEKIKCHDLPCVDFVASKDGKLYVLLDGVIYHVESDGTTHEVIRLKNFPNTGMQGFDIFDGVVYVNLSHSFLVMMYDFKTGKLIKEVGFANHTNVGHTYEYTADISVVDGDIFTTPHTKGDLTQVKTNATNMYSDFSWYINYIAKIGLKTGNNTSDTIFLNYEKKNIHVVTENPSNYHYATGSSGSPLRLLSEYFMNQRYKHENYILHTESDSLTYYGCLNLINTSFNTPIKIKCHAIATENFVGSLRDIEVDSKNVNIVPFTFLTSNIHSLNMVVKNNSRDGLIATSYVNNHVKIIHKCRVSNSYVKCITNSNTIIDGYSQLANIRYTVSDSGDEHIYSLNVGESFSCRYLMVQFKYKTLQSYMFMIPNTSLTGQDAFEESVFTIPEGNTQMTLKYDDVNKKIIFKGTNSRFIRQVMVVTI